MNFILLIVVYGVGGMFLESAGLKAPAFFAVYGFAFGVASQVILLRSRDNE